jgi:sugar lactone lactonase YvrE
MKQVLSTLGRVAVIFVLLCQAFASPLLADAHPFASPAVSPTQAPNALVFSDPGTLPLGFHYTRTFGVLGQPYPGTGQNAYLNQPGGLVIEGSTLYAAEAGGSRLWQFNMSSTPGTPVTPWAPYGVAGINGKPDRSDTVVSNPNDVWKDPSTNYMWVANWYWGGSWITIFNTSTGLPLANIRDFVNPGGMPFGDTSLNCINGILADPTVTPFRLFVSESCGQNSVLVFAVDNPYDNATRTVTLQSVIQGSFNNPRQLALTDLGAGRKLYVSHQNGLVAFAETSPNTWTTSGPAYNTNQEVRGLGLNPTDGGAVYAAANSNNGPVIYRCYYPDPGSFNCGTYIQGSRDGGSGNWIQVLNDPQDIAFDAAGNAYVSDRSIMTIEKFTDPNGLPAVFYGTRYTGYVSPAVPDPSYYYNSPAGVAVDANYNLYILESGGHRLTKLGPSGAFIGSFGVAGLGGGQNSTDRLSQAQGTLAFDAQGRVYIPDRNNNRVVILDSDLSYLGSIGNQQDENYRFNCPAGVAIGPNGDIFVADDCANNIQVYTSDRFFRSKIGIKYEWGTDNNHFNQPGGVAVLDTNTILVADGNNGRIQKCVRSYGSPDLLAPGEANVFTDSWSCTTFAGITREGNVDTYRFNQPNSIAWDASNRRVFVGDQDAGVVKVLDETGKLLVMLGEPYTSDNSDNYHFFTPMSVAVDAAGNLYVADMNNHRVQKYIPALAELELAGQIGGPIERVVKDGSYLYAKVGARLGVFSLTDPAQPSLYGLSDLLPGTIFNGPVIRNNQAYTLVSDNTLRIFSLADLTHPAQTGLLPINNPQGLAVRGNWAFVGTCCNWTPSGQTPRVLAVDVSDPAAPKVAAVYDLPMFANGDNYIHRIETFTPASGPIQVYLAAHNRGIGQVTFDSTQLPAHPELAFGNPQQFNYNGNYTEFVVNPSGSTIYTLDVGKQRVYAVQTSDMSGVSEYNTSRTNWIALDGNLLYVSDGQILDIYDPGNLKAGPQQSVNINTLNRPANLGQFVPVGTRIYDAAGELGLFTLDYTIGFPNMFTFRGQVKAPAGSPGFLEGIGSTIYDGSWNAGLRIINADNPAQMQEIYPGGILDSGVNSVTVERASDKTYAFLQINVAGNSQCALAVADVTDPLNVTILANSDTGSGVTNGVFGCGAGRMRSMPGVANHEWVFMLGANSTPTGSDLLVFDVNLGGSPVVIGNGVKSTILGDQNHGTSWGAFYTSAGTTYLLAAERNSGIRVVNVTTPASPVNVGMYLCSPNNIEVLNGKAYISDFNRGLVVLDLANIATPATLTELGNYWFQDWTGYLRVKAFGAKTYVYMPNGGQGLRVLDATTPAQIRQVDIAGVPGGFAFAGYATGSLFYESVMNAGLYAYWAAPTTEANLTNASQTLDSSAVDGTIYRLNGASPAPVTLLHIPVFSGNTPSAPSGLRTIGHAYSAFARNPDNDQPVTTLSGGATYTVSIQYTDAEIAGLNENSLAFYSWNGSQWVKELSSTVNADTNTLTATPNHFSLWTVLGSTDSTPPTGTLTINTGSAYTNLNAVSLGLTYDPDTTLVRYQETTPACSGPSCAWTAWEAVAATRAFTLSTGDGPKTVGVELQDAAGNASTTTISDSITLDQTAPTGSFAIAAGSLTNLTAVTLNNIVATDDGSGMVGGGMRFSEKADFSDNPTWQTPATTFPFTLSSGDGLKTIYAQFKDAVGNVTSAEVKAAITLDQTAPTGTLYINGGAAVTTSPTVSLTLAASDNLSGPAKMRFSTDPAFVGVAWVTPYTPVSSFVLLAGDGSKTVHAQVQDAAGNTSSVAIQATILLDTNPPTGGSIVIDPARKPFSGTPTVNLTLAATDATEMRLSNSSSFPGADATFMAYATTKTGWVLSTGDGPKNVYVQYRDSHGLLSAVFSDSTVLDTTAPASVNLYINGGATLTASVNVKLFMTFTETGSGVSQYRVATSLGGLTSATYAAYANPANYTLATGDGLKTVCIQVKDGVGNEGTGVCKTITLDSTAPTGTLLINSGAASTLKSQVTLTLAASDVTSPTGLQMLVSNTNSCATGTWQPLQASLSWTLLPGLGNRTVYVCYRDAAGNVSAVFSDNIRVNASFYLPITRR